jgi:2,4-dienoyl-CoA reductase-like NADH-dependent reductase (Old Yellow Enzyme family)
MIADITLTMDRNLYKIFSAGAIAGMNIPNRLVRSATWDPSILTARQMTEEVLDLYRDLALGGVGAIITGGFPVYRERFPEEDLDQPVRLYADLRINGLEKIARIVHQARPGCRIIAQLEVGYLEAGPSSIPSPFSNVPVRALSLEEIEQVVDCFVDAISDMRDSGYDGIQLHAAHGGLLSRFLSPYTNLRQDDFGGTPTKRSHIVQEIVSRARKRVGGFPILIKMNCTDYLVGGVDIESFPALAREMVNTGVDAIELSGGMWECLFRPEEELGFRPVPAPESHTRIRKPEQQSYFLGYAEKLDLPVPIILVGGNRDIEKLEAILQAGRVDFIALCRPLIREPDLPKRWRAGLGSRLPECVSCNSCLYAMYVHPGTPEPGLVTCICKNDKQLHKKAQKWLATWRERQKG